MVYWWGRDYYFGNTNIQINDIDIMNAAFGLSGHFVSRVRSNVLVVTLIQV